MVASIDLPTGAIIKEVNFTGQNSSAGSSSFFVERYQVETGANDIVADVGMPAGGATIPSGMVAVNHVVDPSYSYDAAAFTSTSIRMYSCRIGFAGPFGFFPVNPQVRKLDTRFPGPLTGKFLIGQTKTLGLAPAVPAGAAAALLNITVTGTEGSGFLAVFPGGVTPTTSAINWSESNQTVANNATVAVSPAGGIKIFCNGVAGCKTHVIVDVLGFLR